MRELILFTLSGLDKPGLTSELTRLVSEAGVGILDIGQATIHDTLSLGLLLDFPAGSGSNAVIKDLLFKAHELGLNARFEPVDPEAYEAWVGAQGKPRHIITVLGTRIDAQALHRISAEVASNGLNIDSIKRLSGRISLNDERATRACVELTVRGVPTDATRLRASFLAISHELGADIAFQVDNVYRRNRRLVVFDMDSTLIRCEVIDELAKAAGVGAEVAVITEEAMQGKLDFRESFARRVALLKGLDASVLERIADTLPMQHGAERLITTLKSIGYKTAILSGGFQYFGDRLKSRLGIDHVHANELVIRDGKVTGEVGADIVDGRRKAELLKSIAQSEGIRLEQVIAVGDGANDLPMLSIAGLGIAFHAKPVVKAQAGQAISHLGLDGILYLIGVRDRDIM
jgi:phosphoserine phosphatase